MILDIQSVSIAWIYIYIYIYRERERGGVILLYIFELDLHKILGFFYNIYTLCKNFEYTYPIQNNYYTKILIIQIGFK
jgi:hypothetical protein